MQLLRRAWFKACRLPTRTAYRRHRCFDEIDALVFNQHHGVALVLDVAIYTPEQYSAVLVTAWSES